MCSRPCSAQAADGDDGDATRRTLTRQQRGETMQSKKWIIFYIHLIRTGARLSARSRFAFKLTNAARAAYWPADRPTGGRRASRLTSAGTSPRTLTGNIWGPVCGRAGPSCAWLAAPRAAAADSNEARPSLHSHCLWRQQCAPLAFPPPAAVQNHNHTHLAAAAPHRRPARRNNAELSAAARFSVAATKTLRRRLATLGA
jgi:hypothetical protein